MGRHRVYSPSQGTHRPLETEDQTIIDELMEVGRDKRTLPLEELRWIVTNMNRAWRKIDSESVPSDYAVSLLVTAKEDKPRFMQSMGVKLIPTKLEDETSQGFTDDRRSEDMLLAQMKEIRPDGNEHC